MTDSKYQVHSRISGAKSEAAAWRGRFNDLVSWVFRQLINRRDVWGEYIPVPQRSDGRSIYTGKGTLTYSRLAEHFFNGRTLGLHSISDSNTCKTLAIDFDDHDGESAVAQSTWAFARTAFDQLIQMGFRPLLTTEGRGGHLRVLFNDPIPAEVAHAFGNWLIRDWQESGLSAAPEVFPKQPRLTEDVRYGNWLRLPGRHHSRNAYSRVWDGSCWLQGNDAIDYMLALDGDDPALIPDEAKEFRVQPPAAEPFDLFDLSNVLPEISNPSVLFCDIPYHLRMQLGGEHCEVTAPAVSHAGGHNATLRLFCQLLDLDLRSDDVLQLVLQLFNLRCSPPWSMRDLLHKLRSAERKADGRWVSKLWSGLWADLQRKEQAAAENADVSAAEPGNTSTCNHQHDGHDEHAGLVCQQCHDSDCRGGDDCDAGQAMSDDATDPEPECESDQFADLFASDASDENDGCPQLDTEDYEPNRPKFHRCGFGKWLRSKRTGSVFFAKLRCDRHACRFCSPLLKQKWTEHVTQKFKEYKRIFRGIVPRVKWNAVRAQIRRAKGNYFRQVTVDGDLIISSTVNFSGAKELSSELAAQMVGSDINESVVMKRPFATSRDWNFPEKPESKYEDVGSSGTYDQDALEETAIEFEIKPPKWSKVDACSKIAVMEWNELLGTEGWDRETIDKFIERYEFKIAYKRATKREQERCSNSSSYGTEGEEKRKKSSCNTTPDFTVERPPPDCPQGQQVAFDFESREVAA